MYLQILDCLNDDTAEHELLMAAVNELRRTDLWMRAYALPAVLPLLSRTSSSNGAFSWLHPYFTDLLEAMPVDLERPVEHLQAAIFSDVPVKLEIFDECVIALRRLPIRSASTPYLDLREFLPETYVLTVLAECLIRGRIHPSIVEDSERAASNVPGFVNDAVKGRYGRMALLQAVRIVSNFHGESGRDEALERIWEKPNRTALEPDLLDAFARLIFRIDRSTSQKADVANRIVDETITLVVLRQHCDPNLIPSNPIITDANQDVRAALAIVLWQLCLWELASETHPEAAASRLGDLWAPRWHPVKQPIEMCGPVTDYRARIQWKHQLELLDDLTQFFPSPHVTPPTNTLGVNSAEAQRRPRFRAHAVVTKFSETTNGEAAVICSPWLSRWIQRGKGKPPQDLRYPSVTNHAVLARLVGAMTIAARLLRYGPLPHRDATLLAKLLVHGFDVLLQYRRWLAKHASPEGKTIEPSLSNSWTSLALHARTLCLRVGRCSLEHVDPMLFMTLLQLDPKDVEQQSEQRDVFHQDVVPGTLVAWIQDAYLAITDDRGPARWITHLPELYEACRTAPTFRHRIESSILMRFLTNQSFNNRELDWRYAKNRGNPLCWTLPHRQLFLMRDLKALDWFKPDWEEPDRDLNAAQLQVRAVERRASLSKSEGLPEEVAEIWRREWLNELGDVAQLMDLDRFLRVRLLELLDDPVLSAAEDEQLVISMLLLEYGSHFDLHRLIAQLFPFDSNGQLQPAVTKQRESVRQLMIGSMLKYVAKEPDIGTERAEPQDPYQTIRERRRVQLVEECLWRLAYGTLTADANDSRMDVLAISLRDSWKRQHNSIAGARQVLHGKIELEGRFKRLVWESPRADVLDWTVRSLTCDWNDFTVAATVDDFDRDDCANLFEWNSSDVTRFETSPRSAEEQTILGIVVHELPDDRGRQYILNCGFRRQLIARLPRQYGLKARAVKAGDVISLRLRWIETPNQKGWRPQAPFRVLPPKIVAGVSELLTVEEDLKNHRLDLRLPLLSEPVAFDVDEWDVDLSRSYAGDAATGQVLATMSDGRWIPVDRDFIAFLLDAFHESCAFAVVAFGGRAILTGSPAYRFTLGFGANYLVPAERIIDEDRSLLEEKLTSQHEAKGMLISVGPVYCEGQVQLVLCKTVDPNNDKIRRSFPNLVTPFDERNLRWKNLDDYLSGISAVRQGSEWYVNTREIVSEPFPEWVRVIPVKGSFSKPGTRFEIRPLSWDSRHCVLEVDAVAYSKLDIQPDQRTPFVESWLELKKGDLVQLTRAYPKHGTDLILCSTAAGEGLRLLVEAESITMRPCMNSIPRQGFSRWAEVVSNPGWKLIRQSFVIDSDEIPETLRNKEHIEGILAAVPRTDEQESSICTIWWRSPEGAIESALRVDNLSSFAPLFLGMKISGSPGPNGWSMQFESRRIIAKALWTRIDPESDDDYGSLWYLGTVTEGGLSYHVAERNAGELVFLRGYITANHLAEGSGRTFRGGIALNGRATLGSLEDAKGPHWVEGSMRMRRAHLRVGGRELSGIVPQNSPQQSTYGGVRIAIRRAGEGSDGARFYAIRRYFSLGSAPTGSRSDEAALRLRKLEDYLANPENLEGALQKQRGETFVRLGFWVPDIDDPGSWSSVVKITLGDGPYLRDVDYPAEARVRLYEFTQGEVYASCRLVPPATVSEYQEDVLGAVCGEVLPLPDWLYYVGEEPGQPGYHRFEWRAGCTILAHESQLRFDGGLFSAARGILFPGDAITRLRFIEDETAPDGKLLEIYQLHLEFAEATRLYRQRTRSKIVHILELEKIGEEVRVAAVIGLSERLLPFEKFERVRHARIDGVELFPDSALGSSIDGSRRIKVLGRLDAQRFLDTLGADLVFEHVRMTFQRSGSGSSLHPGELIFMRADTISAARNDVALGLRPYDGLREADIGHEWARCRVLRRDFSVRDDVLSRLFRRQGPNACLNTVYLVRVSEENGIVYTSLVRGSPARSLKALSAMIDNSRGPLIAAIAERQQAILRVELQPGIYFDVPLDRLQYDSLTIEPGACVRIEHLTSMVGTPVKFRLTIAAFSDAHYIPELGRPAIALPKNSLLREPLPSQKQIMSPGFWTGWLDRKNKPFTIAGLPGIEAMPGTLNERAPRWSAPNPSKLIALMHARHPYRPVWVARDDRSDFRIDPISGSSCSGGRLLLQPDPAIEQFSVASSSDTIPIQWSKLSFADESIHEIEQRCRQASWRCHDSWSGSWTDAKPEWYRLPKETAETGPVFFENRERDITLRYSREHLRSFGFPVQEIFDVLSEKGQTRKEFVVAAPSKDGGLWLELAPGHIAELPAQLVIQQTRSGGFSLANLHWEAFAPGDRVVLELSSDEALRVDHVALVEWHPGVRSAFGQARCFLPVKSQDGDAGFTELGAGWFRLRVPCRAAFPSGRVFLSHDNSIVDASKTVPANGDTILLGIENGSVVALAVPGMRPLPDRQRSYAWEGDPLALELQGLQLTQIIEAAGGALPVTIEAVVPKSGVLYFSRRLQVPISRVPPGALAQVRPLGLLADDKTLLLRCGGGILKAKITDVVCGLPPELGSIAFEILRNSSQPLWLLGTTGNEAIKFGVGNEPSRQFVVEVVDVLAIEKGGRLQSGFICRSSESLTLYWLPASRCAWVGLTAHELAIVREQVRNRPLSVRLEFASASAPVTLIGVPAIAKEFDRLAAGKTLDVTLISERTNAQDEYGDSCWLAESAGTHIVLECRLHPDHERKSGDQIRVEVVQRTGGPNPKLIVAPLGAKKYYLDLPRWMFSAECKSGKQLPEQDLYRAWLNEEPRLPADPEETRKLPAQELDRVLIAAWRTMNSTNNNPAARAILDDAIAQAWINRIEMQTDVNAALAIMAILILYHNGHKRVTELKGSMVGLDPEDIRRALGRGLRQAVALMQDLGRRALHSAHAEVIAIEWLYSRSPARMDDLGRRLERLRAVLKPRLELADIQLVRQFCRAAELRPSRDLATISLALRAALGEPVDASPLMNRAVVSRELVSLLHVLPVSVSGYPIDLPSECLNRLELLLTYIHQHDLYITLLDPLIWSRPLNEDKTVVAAAAR